MTKNNDNSIGETGTFAKIKDAYTSLNNLWPIYYPFKKIKKVLKNKDSDNPSIYDVSFQLRRKIEKYAKKKFPNDPKAVEKAILEAKDMWLTKARSDDFLQNTIKRIPKKDSSNKKYLVDIDKILRLEHQSVNVICKNNQKFALRDDDFAILQFMHKNGELILESELRKKFLQPRTTMWRSVKRLERNGFIIIDKSMNNLQNTIKFTYLAHELFE